MHWRFTVPRPKISFRNLYAGRIVSVATTSARLIHVALNDLQVKLDPTNFKAWNALGHCFWKVTQY